MAGRNLIVIGASMGGIEALSILLSQLPADLNAAVAIVQHTSPMRESRLAGVLGRTTPLPVHEAVDGEALIEGRVYVARPDCHMIVLDGKLRIGHGPRENGSRPAIDPLFRTAAVARRNAVIGIILTGMLDDGATGLRAIKRCGGLTIVQDPADAAYPDMPNRALELSRPDHVVRLENMGLVLEKFVKEGPADPAPPIPKEILVEVQLTERAMGILDPSGNAHNIEDTESVGELVPFTCPECGGAMWEIPQEERFRCHVGHAFTVASLLAEQDRSIEQALWAAVRTLEERYKALDVLASQQERLNRHALANTYSSRAEESRAHARRIRELLLRLAAVPRKEDA